MLVLNNRERAAESNNCPTGTPDRCMRSEFVAVAFKSTFHFPAAIVLLRFFQKRLSSTDDLAQVLNGLILSGLILISMADCEQCQPGSECVTFFITQPTPTAIVMLAFQQSLEKQGGLFLRAEFPFDDVPRCPPFGADACFDIL